MYLQIERVEFACQPESVRIESTLRRFVDPSLAQRLEREAKSDAQDTPLMGDIERRVSAALGVPVLIRVVF